MCTAKTPKQPKVEEKEVQYLTNVWTDGTTASQGIARNSLRMDLGSGQQPTVRLPVVATNPAAPVQTPKSTPGAGSSLGMQTGRGYTGKALNVQQQLL